MTIQAYILIQTEVGKASSVATAIRSIPGVTLAEGVTGPYDVLKLHQWRNLDTLS
jgi:hypothetical protein